jgi:transcriptional regulator with XRE-family HTH domain
VSIGNRIKAARKAAGLSQEELARRADLSLNGFADIERESIKDPHYSSLRKISDALGVPIGELLEAEPVPLAEAPPSGPLTKGWALEADPDLFRRRIKEAASNRLRELGEELVAVFYPVRTLDELREEGTTPAVVRRARASMLAGIVDEELVRRGEEPLRSYLLAFRAMENALSVGFDEATHEEGQEHQAG